MNIVDQVVTPHATRVLVDAHGPVRHHLAVRVCVEFRQFTQFLDRHPAELRHGLLVIVADEFRVLVETHGL